MLKFFLLWVISFRRKQYLAVTVVGHRTKQPQALLSNKLPVWTILTTCQLCVLKFSQSLNEDLERYSALKNSKMKNVDWQIEKQVNTQVKLHFEKSNYKNKMYSQKSHFTAQGCLSRQFHVQLPWLRPCISFSSLLEFNIFSGRKLLILSWK